MIILGVLALRVTKEPNYTLRMLHAGRQCWPALWSRIHNWVRILGYPGAIEWRIEYCDRFSHFIEWIQISKTEADWLFGAESSYKNALG